MSEQAFEQWAVLELMGHRRIAGLVTEVDLFGCKLVRIDIPQQDGALATQYYGGQAIYCLTPTTEENARAVAARNVPQPIHRWELPQLPAQTAPADGVYEEDDEILDRRRDYE